MDSEHPPFIELSLPAMLEKVKDADKAECIKVMLGTIRDGGVIAEIRKLVNDPGYDD
jgi:hypothetical protein